MLTAARTLAEAIFLVLLAAPPFHADPIAETDLERSRRLLVPALAITATCGPLAGRSRRLACASELVSLARQESALAAYVGLGRCADGPRGMRCDPGPDGEPTSRTYWQLKRATCPAVWAAEPASVTETFAAARCARRELQAARRRCAGRHPDGDLAGALSGYMGGAWQCRWPGASRFVALERRTRRRLTLALDK